MPIYQYKCVECDHALEALQKMSDPKLVDCPECRSPALKKQVTSASFKLKGTGWYETDFKNSGKKPETKTPNVDSSPVTESKPSAETSSVTSAKPATVTE